MRLLVTGAAGFIGSYVVEQLLEAGDLVHALDNLDDTVYPAAATRARLGRLAGRPGFTVHEADLNDGPALERALADARPEVVVHLAGLANPRMSVRRPTAYTRANVDGTLAVLEAMRRHDLRKIVVASSSTVYGGDPRYPWHEDLPCDRPLNPYAVSKRAVELMCHAYHATAGFDVFALRFFTAYGPWGRSDMGWYQMTRAVVEGESFRLFDAGRPRRDFTYVADVAAGVVAAARRVAGFELINLGRGEPIAMRDFVRTLEELTGRTARWEDAPLPPSDAPTTYADIAKARRLLDYNPGTSLREGLSALVTWYRQHQSAAGVA